MIDSIIRELGNWLLVTNMFEGLSLLDFRRDWKTYILMRILKKNIIINCWSPPPSRTLKLNFDGSSLGNPGSSGFGGAIRDSNGDIVRVVAGPIGRFH